MSVQIEDDVPPPTPRCNCTLTVNPLPKTNELIIFGGEAVVKDKTMVYSDLYVFHVDKQQWWEGARPARSFAPAFALRGLALRPLTAERPPAPYRARAEPLRPSFPPAPRPARPRQAAGPEPQLPAPALRAPGRVLQELHLRLRRRVHLPKTGARSALPASIPPPAASLPSSHTFPVTKTTPKQPPLAGEVPPLQGALAPRRLHLGLGAPPAPRRALGPLGPPHGALQEQAPRLRRVLRRRPRDQVSADDAPRRAAHACLPVSPPDSTARAPERSLYPRNGAIQSTSRRPPAARRPPKVL